MLGGSGMLGTDVCAELLNRNIAFAAPTSAEVDITDSTSIAGSIIGKSYTHCLNCAAYTAVDLAETERDQAYLVNAIGAGYVAQSCGLANVRLIHISTDFVFDGSKGEPYSEDDATNPLGVYGASKLEGERSVIATANTVVRTSWLYGVHGKSFPRTILNAWRAGRELRVVADQVGCPTSTVDLARVLVDMIRLGPPPGVFHASGPDAMSWHEFACILVEAAGGDRAEIMPIETGDWPTPARRPAYSVLSNWRLGQLGVAPMRPAPESIAEFVAGL